MIHAKHKILKNWKKYLLLGTVLFPIVYWLWFFKTPLGWQRYTDWDRSFTFIYPNEWHVQKCDDGMIALAKTPIDRCYLPLEAPQEYRENVVLQTFVGEIDSQPQTLPPNWSSAIFETDEMDCTGRRVSVEALPTAVSKEEGISTLSKQKDFQRILIGQFSPFKTSEELRFIKSLRYFCFPWGNF